MNTGRIFRLREGLGALTFSTVSARPSYVRLEAGVLLTIMGELPSSGLVEVFVADAAVTVFAEDLLSRAEIIAARGAAWKPPPFLGKTGCKQGFVAAYCVPPVWLALRADGQSCESVATVR